MTCCGSFNDRPRGSRAGFLLLVGLIALVAGGKAILSDTLDPDCFWHLRVAGQLRTDGIGPLADRLSFASIQSPWTPYSWLAELGMRWLWDHAGWRSIIAVQAIMQAALVGLIAWSCRAGVRTSELKPTEPHFNPFDVAAPGAFSAVIATAFAAFLSLPYLSFRPVTAALVLIAAAGALLVRDRRHGERTRSVWLIVPIAALTVNLHLYAIFIPLWIFSLLSGAIWEWRHATFTRPETERRATRYGYLLIATGLACLATPMLPGVISSALKYQYADPMVAGNYIPEMQPFFRGTMGTISAALVTISLACVVAGYARIRAGEWVWLAFSTVLLFRLGRFAPIFAIAMAPIFAATLPNLSDRLLSKPIMLAAMSAVLLLGIGRVVAQFPSRSVTLDQWLNRRGSDVAGYPCAAAEFVAADVKPITGRIVNEFSWGGYLEWRLGDRYQTLLDGRTQLFTPELWRATCLGTNGDRKRFLQKVHADAAILPSKGSEFHDALVSLGWRSAFRDDRAEVLLPPAQMRDNARDWSTALFVGE